MITCTNCSFDVDNKLRYALMKNSCPACGNDLFSPEDMNHISMIQSRVLLESFASKLDQADAYDVSLFIFNEMKYGLGGVIIGQPPESSSPKPIAPPAPIAVQDSVVISTPEFPVSSQPFDPEDIRREIEQELPEISTLPQVETPPIPTNEEPDDKVKRLKEVAKKNPFGNKRGPAVKRLS